MAIDTVQIYLFLINFISHRGWGKERSKGRTSNGTTEHTIETTVHPEAIWQQWIDVEGWKKTDPGVVESQLHGDLRVGATGRLKPKGGPAIRFVITNCEPLRSFSVENGMPLAHMAFEHEMKPTAQGTQFTHRIRITGLLSPLWERLIGQQIAKDLPGVTERMVAAAAKPIRGQATL